MALVLSTFLPTSPGFLSYQAPLPAPHALHVVSPRHPVAPRSSPVSSLGFVSHQCHSSAAALLLLSDAQQPLVSAPRPPCVLPWRFPNLPPRALSVTLPAALSAFRQPLEHQPLSSRAKLRPPFCPRVLLYSAFPLTMAVRAIQIQDTAKDNQH